MSLSNSTRYIGKRLGPIDNIFTKNTRKAIHIYIHLSIATAFEGSSQKYGSNSGSLPILIMEGGMLVRSVMKMMKASDAGQALGWSLCGGPENGLPSSDHCI